MTVREMTFWDHLDELKKVLIRVLVVVVIFTVTAFVCKEWLFDLILAPGKPDFVFYRALGSLADALDMPSLRPESFRVELISTQLTSQFVVHMTTALYTGILFASPYILYAFFGFIAPALYEEERRYSRRVVFFAFALFFTGVLLSYYIIFPLSFRFLATYQVAEEVVNTITIASYTGTFFTLLLMMGLLFEIPIVSWLLGKLGILSAARMQQYRRHAVVSILIVAAIITPTTDIFTLSVVTLPIYLLYELSIFIVRRTAKSNANMPTPS